MLLRLIFLVFLVIVLGALAAWVADHPGSLTLFWLDYRVDTSVAVLIGIMALLVLSGIILAWLWRLLVAGPRRLRQMRFEKRYARGLRAVTHTLSALALSDIRGAERYAKETRKYLKAAPLTLLLNAQIARMKGDDETMRSALETLLTHDETRFMAARALSEHTMLKDQPERAMAYARQALSLAEDDPHALVQAVGLHLRLHQYAQAHALMAKRSTQRALPRRVRKHTEALILAAEARDAASQGRQDAALSLTRQAWRLDSAYLPFTLLYAEMLSKSGDASGALALLLKAWRKKPERLLAEAILRHLSAMPAEKALKRAVACAKEHSEHALAQWLAAQVALSHHAFDTAQHYARLSWTLQETRQTAELLADLEERRFADKEAAKQWREKAAELPVLPSYRCLACGHVQPAWEPHCPSCRGFDTLSA